MKLYHYTKGWTLNSIFTDGFIATEGKRGLSKQDKFTDYVWFTEKNNYPKTALPSIPLFPETNLSLHLQHKSLFIDFDKLGHYTGNLYRFGFDSSDQRFKKWWHCEERKKMQCNDNWRSMESVANKVGDDARSFWISVNDVQLEDFSLDVFAGGWINLIEQGSITNANLETLTLIYSLMEMSANRCKELGMPLHQVITPIKKYNYQGV